MDAPKTSILGCFPAAKKRSVFTIRIIAKALKLAMNPIVISGGKHKCNHH